MEEKSPFADIYEAKNYIQLCFLCEKKPVLTIIEVDNGKKVHTCKKCSRILKKMKPGKEMDTIKKLSQKEFVNLMRILEPK